MPSSPRASLRKLLAALAATLLALLLGEGLCRFKAHRDNQASMYVGFSEERHLVQGERVALIDIIRVSGNDRIVFELKPNLKAVPFTGAPLTTNSHGFRGPEISREEEPGTITIVGLGDSIMFGYGVGDGKNYLSQFEAMLNERYPQKRWRVINTGVPAYNTVMEVETLRTKGLPFGPDLVILNLVPNDLVLPQYVRQVDDVLDLGRSFLAERVAALLGADTNRTGVDRRAGRDPRLAHHKTQDHANLPEQYKALVGFEAFTAALAELKALAAEHDFPVITLSTIEDQHFGRLLEAAAQQGFSHVNLLPEIQQYMWKHHNKPFSAEQPEAYMNSKLVVSPTDGHPSLLQHWMIAAKLLATLEQQGVIDRLLAQ